MLHEKISLSMPGSESYAAIYTYFTDVTDEIPVGPKPTVIVCPGGGYHFTSDREAEPLALRFNAYGINAVVLRYSVSPAVFPTALLELAKTVEYVKTEGVRYGCDPERIFTMGFSAGGHLAASYGVFWKRPYVAEAVGCDPELLRVRGQLLCYPVISSGTMAHHGSIMNLLGRDYEKQKDFMSLENFVTEDTPSTFIWATQDDAVVPVENSLMFVNALQKAAVKCEFHMYLSGPHGLSLADRSCSGPESMRSSHVAKWITDCIEFIDLV